MESLPKMHSCGSILMEDEFNPYGDKYMAQVRGAGRPFRDSLPDFAGQVRMPGG
jgi:hypothetical protein